MEGVEYQTVSRFVAMNAASSSGDFPSSSEMTNTVAPCFSGDVDVEHREVEVKGGVAAEAIHFGRREHIGAPVHEAERVLVAEHHALRDPGGPGGVQDVGEVVAARPPTRAGA